MSQALKKRRKRKPPARCKVARKRKPRTSQYGFDPELGVEGARRKKSTKRPACRRRKRRRPRRPVAQPTPPPPSLPAAPGRLPSPVALYDGAFGRAQAERLLWRAGFGPSPGWPEALAAMGMDSAVESLIPRPEPRPSPARSRVPDRRPIRSSPSTCSGTTTCSGWIEWCARTSPSFSASR